MNDAVDNQAWLIGGAGRSGKTTLAKVLLAHSRKIAGFPLEGVLHVYLQRHFPFFRAQRNRLLEEYLDRPRYIDAQRTKVEYPRDHINTSATALIRDIPDRVDHPIKLFAWILDRFAAEHGRTGWAVFDLLPELRYATYRKLIPGAKLIVMRRTPYEAVAEALFWRTYPDAPKNRRRRFQTMLFQWCLSQRVSDIHAARHPKDVFIFSFNALVTGDEVEQSRLANLLDMDISAVGDSFAFSPPFAFDHEQGFRGPDGISRQLLTTDELEEIRLAAAGGYARLDLATLLRLAPHAPVLAHSIGDFLLHPRVMLIRRANAIRQRAKDAIAGIRQKARNQT